MSKEVKKHWFRDCMCSCSYSKMTDFRRLQNNLHIVAWIFAIIAGSLIANLTCFGCSKGHFYENQCIDGIVYGFVIITSLLFANIFFDEEVPEKMSCLLYCSAGVLYITAAILLFIYRKFANENRRALCSGIFCCFNGVIFVFEFLASLTRKDMLD